MYHRQQLGLYFKLSSIHPLFSVHPSSLYPSSLHPSFRPFINTWIKMIESALFISPYLHPSIPSSFQLFIPLLHPFIFCSRVDGHYLSIIHSFIILPSMKHSTQLHGRARPLFICQISRIGSRFPAETHLSTHSRVFFIFLHPHFCSPFPVVIHSESFINCVLSPERCVIQELKLRRI